MSKCLKISAFAAAAALLASSANGSTVRTVGSIDLTGIRSNSIMGSALNEKLAVNLNMFPPLESRADAVLTGVGWNLIVETAGTSFLSDIRIGFGTAAVPNQFELAPSGDNFPGTGMYSSAGILMLPVAISLPGGIVDIEFFEVSDDNPGNVDATYLMGSTLDLEFTFVPEPAQVFLPTILGVLVLYRRSRRIA